MTASTLRIHAIVPHPDDAEILCAGTLMRLVALGHEVHLATMTPGDKGSPNLPPDEIAAIRREEAKSGARVIGAASCICLEFRDLEIEFNDSARRRVAAELRRVNADVVITTPVNDYMFDHIVTSMLVRDACFNAPIPNYPTRAGTGPTSRVPWLYYMDPIGGHDSSGAVVVPSCTIDISHVIEQKSEALACHASQREWLRRHHGMDEYIDSMRHFSASRGEQIGVAYGEGFSQHRGHPHPVEDILGELLPLRSSAELEVTGGATHDKAD